jgi:hypothetical protein
LPDPVLSSVRAPFRALAAAFVPEAEELDEAGWMEVEAIVERALAGRSNAIRLQVRALVRLLDILSVLRNGHVLSGVSADRRRSFVERLQDSRFLPLRRGVWGIRTLSFMGYYGRPAVHETIGYLAHPGGWEARRAEGGDG